MTGHQSPILLAEDDKNDIFLMRRAFDSAGFHNPLFVVHNGQEVIDYLQGNGEFQNRKKFPFPGLLLLDLKMPLMGGFDVLEWLRQRPQFERLPAIVLTSSRIDSDVGKSRALGAHDYRVKPNGFEELVRLLDEVRKSWVDPAKNAKPPEPAD
jgi:CheY-like chemotaxis protein